MTGIPVRLPAVSNLSNSSINLLRRCPEKWRRRYIEGEHEPSNWKMVAGSAAGYALVEQNFGQKIASRVDLPVPDVKDAAADSWEDRIDREEVTDFGDLKRGQAKDKLLLGVTAYREQVAPLVHPITVERKLTVTFPGLEWGFSGYIDFEDEDGSVGDLKLSGQRMTAKAAAADPQPTSYLWGRRAEGNPAPGFVFHQAVTTKDPTPNLVTTYRTDAQLDAFTVNVMAAAQEIAWRAENDVWSGPPPNSWWCGPDQCGYFATCKLMGNA